MAHNQDGSSEDDDAVPPYNPQHRFSMAFKRASYHAPDEIWNLFTEAEDCCDIIDYFSALIKALNIDPNIHGLEFYEIFKSKLTSWKCQSLWDLLNARLKDSEYKQGRAAKGKTCMIIGSGPIGLRTAIECLFLGCKTIIVEKRDEFSRNNVLHLWPFLMTDFRNLGAKKFYGKFGAGCIEHINIRTLQCILLKVALILGVEIYVGVGFKGLVEPTDEETGWRAKFEPENHVLSKSEFDIVVGADGKKNVLPGFEQIELRGALAIGITCNFVNNNTIEEAHVNEISGISFQYNQDFFIKMEEQYGVRLENIVYYKDETHYFVMTALKSSLLKLKVIKEEVSDPRLLLHPSNVDGEKLIEFTRCAVQFATDHQLPDDMEFKQLSNGEPDIALFDFTSLKKASNASRILERKKKKLLLTLVGDSLLEPFWPTGSGCGRGVLSALDCAWMIKQYCGGHPPLAVVRERENIFKLLSGINNDSLQKNYKTFTIDPKTRYKAFDSKKISNLASLKSLYDTDDKENADFSVMSPQQAEKDTSYAKRRRRSSSGGRKKSVTSTHVHPHGHSGTSTKHVKRRTDRSPVKEKKEEPPKVGDTKKFWEEHNKKNIEVRAKQHVPKTRERSTPSIEEEIETMEGWAEIDDEVIADDSTSAKDTKLSARSTHSQGKSPRDPKESYIRRQKSRDRLFKRQKSRENLGSTKTKTGAKAKTPDKEQKSLSRGTLKKENTKRKISIKQDPARYDNFLKSSASNQRRVTRSSSRSKLDSSFSDSGTSSSKLGLRKFNARTPSIKRSVSVKRDKNTSIKKNSTINRSCTKTKVRRKTADSPLKTSTRRMMTRSSSGKLLKENQCPKVTKKTEATKPDISTTTKPKNLKRSLGRTSLEGDNHETSEISTSNAKRSRISSLPLPKIEVTSPDITLNEAEIPMSPSPFVFETQSLSNKIGTRLCPLGKRSRLAAPGGMLGNFLKERRAASISVCSPVPELQESDVFEEEERAVPQFNRTDTDIPRPIRNKVRRQSNFKLVRLNSVKNKRKSMLKMPVRY